MTDGIENKFVSRLQMRTADSRGAERAPWTGATTTTKRVYWTGRSSILSIAWAEATFFRQWDGFFFLADSPASVCFTPRPPSTWCIHTACLLPIHQQPTPRLSTKLIHISKCQRHKTPKWQNDDLPFEWLRDNIISSSVVVAVHISCILLPSSASHRHIVHGCSWHVIDVVKLGATNWRDDYLAWFVVVSYGLESVGSVTLAGFAHFTWSFEREIHRLFGCLLWRYAIRNTRLIRIIVSSSHFLFIVTHDEKYNNNDVLCVSVIE